MTFAPVTHILPLTTVRRERLLPLPGRIIVRKGQKVSATDVIAESNLAPQHMLLDVVRGLGLAPRKVEDYIHRQAGDHLDEGDLIAGPVGWPKRVVRAPTAGKIILIRNGRVLYEVEKPLTQLRAGLPGTVITLIGDRGVEIENSGTLVQGVWGNGAIDAGLLRVLIGKPEDVLTADRVDVGLRGAVVLAGYCGEAGILQTAAEIPLRGLILSSMASSLVTLASRMLYPIMILEGFGLHPMNSAAYNLLTTNNQREIAVNAEIYDRYTGTRPEAFIPLPVSGKPAEPRDATLFAPNQRVRVVRAPHSSQVGMLVALRPELEVFASGVRAPAAEVRLESGTVVILPLANLEVLE